MRDFDMGITCRSCGAKDLVATIEIINESEPSTWETSGGGAYWALKEPVVCDCGTVHDDEWAQEHLNDDVQIIADEPPEPLDDY